MLDITPPTFSGSDHEKVEQMAKYINELYESINRKTSCLTVDDFSTREQNILKYVLYIYRDRTHGT